MLKTKPVHLKTDACVATMFVLAFSSGHRLVNSIPALTLVWRDHPAKQRARD